MKILREGRASATVRLLAVALVLAAIWVAGVWLAEDLPSSPDALAREIRELGGVGPLLLAGLMVLAVVVGPIPTFPVSVTAGLVYGPLLGTLYAVAGATAGALMAFLLARLGGRPLAARVLRGHVAFCSGCSDRLLFWVVLVARLLPVMSFALASYAAGLTAMSAGAFTLATVLGMIPMTVVYVTLGATLQISFLGFALASVVLLVLMLAGPWWLERRAPGLLRRLTANVHGGAHHPESLSARNGDSS